MPTMPSYQKAIVFVAAMICVVSAIEIELSPEDFEGSDAIPSGLLKTANEAYDINMQGLDFLEAGDLDAALEMFLEAERKFPGYTDAQNNRGVVYYRRGAIDRAAEIWTELTKKDDRYALAYYNLGMIAFHQRNFEKADRLFEEALERNGKLVDAQVMRGRCAMARSRIRKAESLLEKAFQMNKKHEGAWGYYAHALVMGGDTTKALSILEKHRKHPGALQMRGAIAAARNDNEAAAQYYEQAAETGGAPTLLLSAASLFLEDGNCHDAQAVIKRYFGARVAPTADAFLWAGIVAKECGEEAQALHYFQEGVDQHAGDALLRFNFGKLLVQGSQCEKALAAWEPLRDTFQDPNLYYLRARCLREMGALSDAERSVRVAISMHNSARYHDFLGVLLFEQGKSGLAEKEFKKALALEPGHTGAQLNLSLLGATDENLAQSIEETRKALEKCGENCRETAQRLAALYYRDGTPEKALDILREIPRNQWDLQVYQSVAFYLRELHRWGESVNVLREGLDRFPQNDRLKRELVDAYLGAGEYVGAIEVLEDMTANESNRQWRLLYQLGYAYMEMNRLDKARESFQASLAKKSDFVAAKGLLAYLYSRDGATDKAEKLWKETLTDDPDNRVVLINLGIAAEQSGDYRSALSFYQKAEKLDPSDKTIKLNIGNALDGLGNTHDARNAYTEALNSEKRATAAYNLFMLGQKEKNQQLRNKMISILREEFNALDLTKRAEADLAIASGDSSKALGLLTQLKSREPADWYLLAQLHLDRRQISEARACLDSIGEDRDWQRKRRLIEARIAFEEGGYQRALELWRAAGDSSPAIRYNMALAAFRCDLFEDAYEMAAGLAGRPGKNELDADALRLAGNAALELALWDDAIGWHEKLLEISPDAVTLFNLAVIHYNAGDIERSWDYYQRAREKDSSLHNTDIENRYKAFKEPSTPKVDTILAPIDQLYNQAVKLQSAGDEENAEKLYREILDREKDHARSWNNLGTMLAARGELEEAQECYIKAVKHEKNLPEAYANLVNLLLAVENTRDARKWATRGLKSYPENQLLKQMLKQAE